MRVEYTGIAVDASGDVVANPQIELRRKGDDSLGVLYTTATGGTTKTNPFDGEADGSFAFFVDPGRYDLIVGTDPTQTTTTLDLTSAVALNHPDQMDLVADQAPASVSGSTTHPDVRQKLTPWLSGTGSALWKIPAVDDIRLGGFFDQNTSGGRVIGFEGAVNGFIFSGMDLYPSGFGISIKTGNGTGGWAENGLVTDYKILGGATTADVGITTDGDARNIVFLGGVITNIQRSDGGGSDAHANAIAGDAGDAATTNDAENIIILGQVVCDIEGEFLHVEDAVSRIGMSFSVGRDAKRGIEVTNDNVPHLHNYIGNHFAYLTEYFATFAGTGSSKNVNLAFNIFDGDGATPAVTYAVRVNQNDTKNFNILGNMFFALTNTGGAFYSNAQGPMQVSYNIFESITGDCLTFDDDDMVATVAHNTLNGGVNGLVTTSTARNSPDDLRGVWVESNNTFEGVTNVAEKANAAGLMGDQRVFSPVLDSDTASNTIMFVAQRKGYLTGVTRVLAANGGAGTSNSTVTLYKTNSGGSTALWSGGIPRTGSQYDAFLWGAENSAITDNSFAAGDVIRIECDGVEDASTLFHIQLDFFYYNG